MSIAVPVLDAITHPPLGVLQRELIPGIGSGSHDLTRPGGPLNVNAYGLTWDAFTVPITWGRTLGNPDVFENRLLQASTVHTGIDSHDLVSEYHDFYAEGIYWLWENPFPTRVHVEINVGITLVLFWLIL